MLDIFKNVVWNGQQRILLRWSLLLDTLVTRLGDRYNRFLISPPRTSGAMRILESILFSLETEYIASFDSDEDIFFFVKDKHVEIAERIDIIHRKTPLWETFFAKNTSTAELVVTTSYENPTRMLKKANIIQSVPAVYIYRALTPNLHYTLIGDQLLYYNGPDLAVIGVNLSTLALQWIAYVRQKGITPTVIQHPRDFIHYQVIAPLEWQAINQWLLSILMEIFTDPSEDNIDRIYETYANEYNSSWIPKLALRAGITEVGNLVEKLHEGQIYVGDILQTKLLLDGTILQYLADQNTFQEISENRLYGFAKWLANYPILKCLLTLMASRPDDGVVKTSKNKVNNAFMQIVSQRVTSLSPDPALRKVADQEITELTGVVKQMMS